MRNPAKLQRLRSLVEEMTPAQKVRLCECEGFWDTAEDTQGNRIHFAQGAHGLQLADTPGLPAAEDCAAATCFPTAGLLGCSFDPRLEQEIGAAIGREASAAEVQAITGINPSIKRSPLCGNGYACYSEDPCVAGELAAARVRGITETGVAACVGPLGCETRQTKRLLSDSTVDKKTLHELYLEPWRRVLAEKPAFVSMAGNRLNGVYAAEDSELTRTFLREECGFEGVSLGGLGEIPDREKALAAGVDLEMPGEFASVSKRILRALSSGRLSQECLDASCVRILGIIEEYGARSKGPAPDYKLHHNLARRAAAESMVLLKNEDDLLPFETGRPLAVIGCFAEKGRTAPQGRTYVSPVREDSLLDELERCGISPIFETGFHPDGSTNDLLIGAAREAAAQAGRALVVTALPFGSCGEELDRKNLKLPDGILKLIDQLAAACPDIAVALQTPGPVELPFLQRIKGLIYCGYAGQAAGGALAELLSGRRTPCGKLAESWPARAEDTPCAGIFSRNRRVVEFRECGFVGYRYYDAAAKNPLFPFGFGLSYTRFRYDAMEIVSNTLEEGGTLDLAVRLSNTGDRPGSETAQCYLARTGSRLKKLVAFEKVSLFPGENRILNFSLPARAFCVYDPASGSWVRIPGEYTLLAASSSRDIRERVVINLEGEDPMLPDPIDPLQLPDLPDKTFYSLLGRTPTEPGHTPYSMDSTPAELRARLMGKILAGSIEAELEDEPDAALRTEILLHMPIRVLSALSNGVIRRKNAEAIVLACRGKQFASLGKALSVERRKTVSIKKKRK